MVAEEPRAALLARDVLVDGGSAADAAVTMFFALSATLPSSVGVTASGSCVVHDPESKTVQLLDFLPRPSSDAPNAIALPLAPRAMFALHARHGTKPLGELIIQAERIARFGAPVSRAFAEELAADGAVLASDATASAVYLPGRRPAAQGTELSQVVLAATLARLRSEGVGTLYSGGLSREFIDGAAAAGYAVDPNRLNDALPAWVRVTEIEHDNHVWGLAAPTQNDLRLVQAALGMLLKSGEWDTGDDGDRADLMAIALSEATLLAASNAPVGPESLDLAVSRLTAGRLADTAQQPQLAATLGTSSGHRAGATSFFAVDSRGQGVGCAVGLGAPFGTGKMIPTLGVFLAPVQAEAVNGPGAYALIVGNENTGQFHMAASGAGGRRAISSMLETVLDHWVRRITIEDVPALPRTHYAGGINTVFVEPSMAAPVVGDLRQRGYQVAPAQTIATGSAFRCVEGLPRRETRCGAAKDPRSNGLMFFEFGG
ncbi:gamma-glutamyltransferase [Thalassobaculum sp. OXR-137]|uniref:gamma-glutamyltransferase n=1 Tax=Thalassobaculum sp. OXR-137 TaxID=3100173 RepID=UPI002AC9875E|nr:gamma-glutamyltransferase [Thalassobaculum sp. OXR-137]WPZ34711.1 gamma-glutamyltransferase [Thalassobaculum sp. OXR-137]